jgi:hypothetical protein
VPKFRMIVEGELPDLDIVWRVRFQDAFLTRVERFFEKESELVLTGIGLRAEGTEFKFATPLQGVPVTGQKLDVHVANGNIRNYTWDGRIWVKTVA